MPRVAVFTAEEIKSFDKPPKFSVEQRLDCFRLSEPLIDTLGRMRSATFKIALVLHFGYFKAAGRFFKPIDFRPLDIRHVAQQLGLDPDSFDSDAYAENNKIHQKHSQIVLKATGFQGFGRNAKGILKEILEQLVISQTHPKTMIYHACAQLHQQRIEIPGYDTFSRLVTDAINDHESRLEQIIAENITEEQKALLETLTIIDKGSSVSKLKLWKHISHAENPQAIQTSAALFSEIKKTYKVLEPLVKQLNLSDPAIAYYGEWVSAAKLSQLKKIKNPNDRYLRLLAFIQDQLYKRHDYLIDTLLRAVQTRRNAAKRQSNKQGQAQRKKTKKALKYLLSDHTSLQEAMEQIQSIVNNATMTDEGKIEAIKNLFEARKPDSDGIDLDEVKNTMANLAQDTGFNEALEEQSRKLQTRVSLLVHALEIDTDNSLDSIVNAITYYRNNPDTLGSDAPTDFMDKEMIDFCRDIKGKIKPSFYKIRLFASMCDAIKGGKLSFNYSYRYRTINDYLIDQNTWDEQKEALIRLAGLSHFKHIEQILAQLKKVLDDKYSDTNEHIKNGDNPHITFKEDGTYTLHTPKSKTYINTNRLQESFTDVGFVPIIKVLNEIHQSTGFLDSFGHLVHKNNKLKPNPITLIAGIIATGCNIGEKKIAGISVGINENTLNQTLNWFFSLKNIEAANERVVGMIKRLALSKIFKEDEKLSHTSSDGKKMRVVVDSLLATYSYKYFGKGKGISAYSFIDDSDALFYSTVLSSSDREASFVLDGLLHNDVIKSDIHSTDTHGYTEFIFAATHLIGTTFAPRIKKHQKQTLYAFKSQDHYENKGYQLLPGGKINTKLIKDNWNDILRLMVSLKLKRVTASQFFKRLNSYSSEHPLYKAMKEFGRIIKSQFILTYTDDVKLRQRITQMLNRIELSNKFGRAIFYGRSGEIHVSSPKEQAKVIACKTLIQSCIVLWNYLYLSQKLAKTKSKSKRQALIESITYGSIQSWKHVNLQGEFDFTKAANSSSFDIKKILEFKLKG